jgi:hypothetical protein
MTYTKNPAPRDKSGSGEDCQAAKLDAVNHSTSPHRTQAPIAAPARRVTVDNHQAFRRAIAPPPDLDDDDGPDLDFIDRPAARRSHRETNRLFAILDSLPLARDEMGREASHG